MWGMHRNVHCGFCLLSEETSRGRLCLLEEDGAIERFAYMRGVPARRASAVQPPWDSLLAQALQTARVSVRQVTVLLPGRYGVTRLLCTG
jgi:hypothetical protein